MSQSTTSRPTDSSWTGRALIWAMARDTKSSKPTGRRATVRVKTARGRTVSQQRWLQRQLNDPYVVEARKRGYRSRAAFKLLQLDDQFKFLRRGARVVDLGAAPGGWTQVAVERVKPEQSKGVVIGIDITPSPKKPLFDRPSIVTPRRASAMKAGSCKKSMGEG